MKIYLLFAICILTSIQFSNAQSYSGPESAEYDYAYNRWLIANTQSHEVLARDNAGVLTVFADSLPSGPYGIEIVGDTLFCCSGGSITGYSLSNGDSVFHVDLGATFLNGITHDNSGNLFVTDYSAKTIHRLNITSQTDSIVASALAQSPNGIIYDQDNNRCLFVNWGTNAPIKAIDLSNYAVSVVVTTTFTNCDGIARDGHGRYYVSNWGSQSVVQYDSAFSSSPVTVVSSLNHPADIFYNTMSDTIAIPNAGNNTVTFFGFSTVGINSYEFTNDFMLYPNPSCIHENAFLVFNLVNSKSLTIDIFDFSGKFLSKKYYEGRIGRNIFRLDKNQDIPSGIYFVSINSEGERQILKWIVE